MFRSFTNPNPSPNLAGDFARLNAMYEAMRSQPTVDRLDPQWWQRLADNTRSQRLFSTSAAEGEFYRYDEFSQKFVYEAHGTLHDAMDGCVRLAVDGWVCGYVCV